MSEQLKKLRDERAGIVTEMRKMHDAAKDSEKGFTPEQADQWDKMDKRCDELDAEIAKVEKLEKLEQRERYLSQSAGTVAEHQRQQGSEQQEHAVDEWGAFRSWMLDGMAGLDDEQRSYMQGRHHNIQNEARALGVGAGNTGGYAVPDSAMAELETAMKAWGGMLESASIMYTQTGSKLPMPTLNFTGVKAAIVGENTQSSSYSGTPFGVTDLDAYTYRSLVLPISIELMQDASFSESQLITPWSEQFGRGLNEHFTVGDGTGKPRGIVTAAAAGKIGTTGQTTSITYDDLIDLKHSVDPAYRRGAKWMFHDGTLAKIKKLKDANNLPIYVRDVLSGMGDMIDGDPFQINQDMPVMAANAKSVMYGRLDKYKIRIVRGLTVLRLVERYADYLQVGFLGFMRADGDLLDAGTNPVKYYQNSAT